MLYKITLSARKKANILTKLSLSILATIFLIGFGGCEKYEFPIDEIEDPEIISFVLRKKYNPQLKEDVYGVIGIDNKIAVVIDYDVSDYVFKPTIKFSNGNTSTPDPSAEIYGKKKTKYRVSNVIKHEEVEYEVEFYINKPLALLYLDVNGTRAYYNRKTEIYHVPIDQSKWGKPYIFEPVGTSDIQDIFIDDTKITSGEEVATNLELGKEYKLTISNTNKVDSVKFILSGLPIVSIEADYAVDNIAPKGSPERSPISISVYDPTEGGQYSVLDKYAGIRIRGASSANRLKKSYSLEFQDKGTLDEVDVSLFGLRSDGDWILDGLSTDVSRVRNRISTDIWNDMHTLHYIASEPKAIPATRGRMTEVYFNGGYRGVYCVTERIDRKQLNLDETNGYLYKAEGWNDHILFLGYDENQLPENGSKRWDGIENGVYQAGYQAEYPQFPYTKWDPIIDLVKFVCDSDDETFTKDISNRFDLNNLVDYFLFINVLSAPDNVGKNTFMCMYNREGLNPTDSYFFYTPWDLDASWGINWDLTRLDPSLIIGESQNQLIKRTIITNPENFRKKVETRWAEIRAGIFSKKSIVKRFRDYQKELEGSGAYERESNMWPIGINDLDSEIIYVEGWLEEHLNYFDKYIQNWDSNVEKLKLQP